MRDAPARDPKRVGILISGRGSNMRALIEQGSGYQVVLVASNKPRAAGLDYARAAEIPTWTWDSKGVPREKFDAALSRAPLAEVEQPHSTSLDLSELDDSVRFLANIANHFSLPPSYHYLANLRLRQSPAFH